ncbi:uncharacterized protein [Asterias amurensis]|uniref:uncharacterized protein n=1 Tax=Asterias amurensis TaxID=7602 RepID=UPI003AB73F36
MIACRLLIIAALLVDTGVLSCSPVEGEVVEDISLEERARQAELVVYGTVLTDEIQLQGDQESVYTLEPECWLKHDNVTFANITIVEQKFDCVSVTLHKGNEYIIFLKYERGQFIVDDVNLQPGALNEPTDEDFRTVYRGIDAGMDEVPDGVCTEGVDIPCFVGDVDMEVCSHGVVVKAAMLSVVMTSLFAKLFFWSG